MAHNLNFNNGKTSFFSVKERAWHGLGTIVQEAPNSEEAIKLAGLNYTVEKRPAFMPNAIPGQPMIEIPRKFATVRTDNQVPFGIVGSMYEVLQNVDAFKFFDEIVGGKEAIYETAGALGAGETIFITAKMPEYIRVGKDDLIEQYVFLTNNHCGEGVVQAAITPIRIVCNNTLNAALRQNSNKVRIMHRTGVTEQVKEAHKLMGIVNKLKVEMEEVFNAMARKPLLDAGLKEIIIQSLATPGQLNAIANNEEVSGRFNSLISEVYAYAQVSDTQQMATTHGTVFGAYNAITGYLQNVKEFESAEGQLVSVLEGSAAKTGQKAFDLCMKLL